MVGFFNPPYYHPIQLYYIYYLQSLEKQEVSRFSPMYSEPINYTLHQNLNGPTLYRKMHSDCMVPGYKYDNIYNKTIHTIAYKDWMNSDYTNIKKISEDRNSLRQTFDGKIQPKFQQKFTKPNSDNQQAYIGSAKKIDNNLRQTLSNRPKLYDQYKYTPPNITQAPGIQNESFKTPTVVAQKIQIDLNKYKEQLEQIQISNKMTEQLRKLKEDRKKRMEATKQNEESENFKRKNAADFYTPKYEKTDVVEVLEQSKTMPLKNPNLEKYKYQPSKFLPNTNQQSIQSYKASFENMNAQQNIQSQKIGRERSHTQFSNGSIMSKTFKVQRSNSNSYNTSPIISTFEISPSKNLPLTILLPGMKIRDFVIGKSLGEGRFGSVYQVFHQPTGAIFALKKVPKERIKAMNMVNQFILQIKLQTFLIQKNILRLYGFFDDTTSIYLILQYMEEGTLYSLLKKKKTLPENVVAERMKQVATAINYLHENQVAHRDIKPENIVITNGVCKICDFGWATLCNSRRKTCCGTFDYTPPEIFEGEEYDYTVDLWCLGVLTYQLLVGKAPFYHTRKQQTKNRIVNVESFSINYPQHLSENAKSFIDSLIRKDPQDRLSSEALLTHPFLESVEQDF